MIRYGVWFEGDDCFDIFRHSYRTSSDAITELVRVTGTELSGFSEEYVKVHGYNLCEKVDALLGDDNFVTAITCGANDTKTVKCRLNMTLASNLREFGFSPKLA